MKFKIILLFFILLGFKFIDNANISPVPHHYSATINNNTNKTIDFTLNSINASCQSRTIYGCNQGKGLNLRVKPHSQQVFKADSFDCNVSNICFGCLRAFIYANNDKIIYAGYDFFNSKLSTFGEISGQGIENGSLDATAFSGNANLLANGLPTGSSAINFVPVSDQSSINNLNSSIKSLIPCSSYIITIDPIGGDGSKITDYKIDIKGA